MTQTDAGRPLRVLLFIHSLHGGGAERVAADLSAHWAGMGRDVMVVTQAGVEGDVYALHPKVRREVLHTADEGGGLRGIWSNVQRVRALRRVVRAFRPDIVLGMMTTASVLSVLACAGLSCRVIATEHTHPPSQTLSGFWQRLRRLTYPRAASVVALTRGTADWLDRHVPGCRLAVIPNPVHFPLPRRTHPDPDYGRRPQAPAGGGPAACRQGFRSADPGPFAIGGIASRLGLGYPGRGRGTARP